MTPEDTEQLGRDIVAAAVLQGDFTLRSGQKSSYYIDKYRLTTEPVLLARITDALVELVPDGVDRIAGTALGAVPLATSLSLRTGLPAVFVRVDAAKDHGTSRSIEGVLESGDALVLVEDVVTTGGASLAAVEILQGAGATIAAVLAVVDREQGGTERFAGAQLPFHALFTSSNLGLEE
ncbi:MAG: orotate phosphoribosyltransferase [Chloroflexota bacterium]|nr:orotate phosphoribosyltransferase [Chloroflexota bacterium]